MSSFIALRKTFDLSSNSNTHLLVGRQNRAIPTVALGGAIVTTMKRHYDFTVDVKFDSQGGSSCQDQQFALGSMYQSLPEPTNAQCIFEGWFTQPTGGTKIDNTSTVELSTTMLYAHWEYVDIGDDRTEYVVQTTSSYKNTGIYAANRYSTTSAVYVDWGDGSVEKVDGNISQLAHTYVGVGTFNVKVSNNLTSFAPSYNNSTWYGTTSQNRYTFKGMISTGSKVTSLPTCAFYYCSAMTNIDFMETCWPTVMSLPHQCFQYCSSLTSIQGAKRFTSLGSQCFRYCSGLSGIQDLSEFRFTTLPNSYTFANCTNVTQWILPSGFNGTTSLGSYMFSNNTKLSALVLPNSLTSTGTYTFQNCSNLNNIIIPSNFQSIGNYAFYGCTSLSNVNIEASNLTAIDHYVFYNCSKLAGLDLPDTVKSIGNYAFYGCTSLDYAGKQNKELPSQLTSIGSYAYQGCSNLKSLGIPENLQTIGDYAFAGCYQISSIVDKRLSAQAASTNTFGSATGTSNTAFTGYQTRGSNILSTYFAATGYDENAWNDPLQNPDKCGFVQQYIDPENVISYVVAFDAGIGSIQETTRTIVKGKKIGQLPVPAVTEEQVYFCGWGTVADDVDSVIYKDYKVTSDMTLYAIYSSQPIANYEVILNDQWQASSKANPDASAYDGVYESFSNYNQGNKAAVMYIKIKGYSSFTIYIRSYAESSYDYTVAFNLDTYTPSNPLTSNPSSSTSGVKAHTSGKQNSGTTIGSYTKVEYTGIDGNEHYICVAYRKDGSVNSGDDRGYVLVEKQDSGTFEPVKYITVNFEVGDGTLVSGEATITDIQGTTISKFPEISAPASRPYFVGWNTQADGSGEYYSNETILPNQESLTLYAYYVAEDIIDPNKDIYLCFTAEQANSTIQLSAVGTAPTVYLETSRTCSLVLKDWSDFVVGETIITLANVGDKVYFRAKQDNNAFATNSSNCNKFVMTGKIAASGNLNTLLKADGSVVDLSGRNYCYSSMFNGCTSLTQAPALPATTLATGCYFSMFNGCTSLTQAPALPVTTLATRCYSSMFRDCTSLTQAPALPVTTLASSCYSNMFNGCANLNNINVNFSAWGPTNATTNWTSNVSSSGTFTCPADLPETYGTSYIPANWEIVRKQ